MAYRIMLVTKEDGNNSSYQFMTKMVKGTPTILEYETKSDIDDKIEYMLNSEGYAKADFIVVKVIGYSVLAYDYSDDGEEDGGGP